MEMIKELYFEYIRFIKKKYSNDTSCNFYYSWNIYWC